MNAHAPAPFAADANVAVPKFMKDRHVLVSIDTSGYCQARCELCVWPELTPSRRMMSLEDFETILNRFEGFTYSEYCLNSINEPFADASLLDKFQMLLDRRETIENFFFSSNWLIPNQAKIDRYADLCARALAEGSVKHVSMNATVSGIDEATYDRWQAGSELTDVNAKYRRLDFAKAVDQMRRLVRALSDRIDVGSRIMLRIKGYGDFDQETYSAFWRSALEGAAADPAWTKRHVAAHVNHGSTTFARHAEQAGPNERRVCQMNWLEEKLVIGPDGALGLCCQEGARKVALGSLLERTLEDLVADDAFQAAYGVVTAARVAPPSDLCRQCEWFVPEETAST